MAVVQRWMLLSCVLDIYIHILISGTLAIHHVCWISTFISQIHQQYIMCTGYLHSYPYLRYISSTACLLLSTFISISQVHQQYSTVIYIPIHISGTLAVNHVYWISTFISISQVHQQFIMCTGYLHSISWLHWQYIMCIGFLHIYILCNYWQYIMCTVYGERLEYIFICISVYLYINILFTIYSFRVHKLLKCTVPLVQGNNNSK